MPLLLAGGRRLVSEARDGRFGLKEAVPFLGERDGGAVPDGRSEFGGDCTGEGELGFGLERQGLVSRCGSFGGLGGLLEVARLGREGERSRAKEICRDEEELGGENEGDEVENLRRLGETGSEKRRRESLIVSLDSDSSLALQLSDYDGE
jgi:hypothetical protein